MFFFRDAINILEEMAAVNEQFVCILFYFWWNFWFNFPVNQLLIGAFQRRHGNLSQNMDYKSSWRMGKKNFLIATNCSRLKASVIGLSVPESGLSESH